MKTIAGTLDKKGRGKRLRDYVVKSELPAFKNGPEGHVRVSDDGKSYVITTMAGISIAFDLCGACSFHVKRCKCSRGPSLPRSVEYVWDQDEALHHGEEWNHQHRNYRGSFTAREAKRNLRMTLPAAPTAYVVAEKKRLSVYVDLARKDRAEAVQRLLRGKKK